MGHLPSPYQFEVTISPRIFYFILFFMASANDLSLPQTGEVDCFLNVYLFDLHPHGLLVNSGQGILWASPASLPPACPFSYFFTEE